MGLLNCDATVFPVYFPPPYFCCCYLY